jgi:hypothetical protein
MLQYNIISSYLIRLFQKFSYDAELFSFTSDQQLMESLS